MRPRITLRHRTAAFVASMVFLSGCADEATSPRFTSPAQVPQASASLIGDRRIEGRRHIVVFKPTVKDVARETQRLTALHGARLVWLYDAVVGGFAAVFPTDAAVRAVAADSRVAFVEADSPTRAGTLQTTLPSWSLDRIDQAALPLSGYYSYVNTGAGVHAYIIDSGINLTHPDLAGRAVADFDYQAGNPFGFGVDCGGHGTEVSGIVGGNLFGVAKGVSLHAVRVLDCSNLGQTSDFIAGINWVALHHQSPSVANVSLYSDAPDAALDLAVSSLVTLGVPTVVIAGNGTANNGVATDACGISPARVASAITVASTTITDARATTSNYGTCVDLLAPGDQVQSDCLDPSFPACQIFGTSFAAPHVTGAIALYLNQKPNATPSQIATAFVKGATAGKLTNLGTGTPNLLLSTNFLAKGKWTTAVPLTVDGADGATALISGTVYRIGGASSYFGASVSLESFNPSQNKWDSLQPLPTPYQFGNGAAQINGKIYVQGGFAWSPRGAGDLLVYDPNTDLWSQLAPCPVAGGYGALVAISGKLYALNEYDSATGLVTPSLYRYDPAANVWSQRAAPPAGYISPAYGVIGGKLYVVGGYDLSSRASDRLDVYDPATDTWTQKTSMPTARGMASGAVLGTKLVVVGGYTLNSPFLGNIESYDATTNTWSFHPSLAQGIQGASAAFIGNLLFLQGGRGPSGYTQDTNQYVTVF